MPEALRRICVSAVLCACASAYSPLLGTAPRAAASRRVPLVASVATDTVDLGSPTPSGPDPYRLVSDELDYIKRSIKKMLTSKKGDSGTSAFSGNGVLTMAAREFMSRKGKSFRPMLVLLIGRATDPDFTTDTRHAKLAVISEMIHTASLIHADVLEEHETDSSQGTVVHQEVALEVGNKVSVRLETFPATATPVPPFMWEQAALIASPPASLSSISSFELMPLPCIMSFPCAPQVCILAGDFLLSKAAVELSLLNSNPVTEIVARGLESICEGGMVAFNSTAAPETLRTLTLDDHLAAVGESIAALIANVCQCSAILSGHEQDSMVAQACRLYGWHLAYARHLVGEAEEIDAALRKSRRNPKSLPSQLPRGVHGVARAPILIAAQTYPEVRAILTAAAEGTDAPANCAELLERSSAAQATRQLAEKHAQEAAEAIEVLPASATRDALVVLCHKVVTGSPLK